MIIKYPLATEKAIRLIEAENKLVFVVDLKATRLEVKEEAERIFNVKIIGVRTMISPDGKKRAYIRFSDETPAIDLATKLGIM